MADHNSTTDLFMPTAQWPHWSF